MLSYLNSNGSQSATWAYAQNAAADNPRVRLITDALTRLIFGSSEGVDRQTRDMIEMITSMLAEQDILPGVYSSGKIFNDMLQPLMNMSRSKIDHQGILPHDFNFMLRMANTANNQREWLQDIIYNENGTINYGVTNGMGARLASQVSSVFLEKALRGKSTEEALVDFNYSSVQDLEEQLSSSNQEELPFERGGSTYRRLDQQLKEYKVLEALSMEKVATEDEYQKLNDQKAILRASDASQEEKAAASEEYHNIIKDISSRLSAEQIKSARENLVRDTNIIDNIRQGSTLGPEGIVVSQDSLNKFQQMNNGSQITETFTTQQIQDQVKKGLISSAENIQFLSKLFGTDDIKKLQMYADELRLGSLTDESNIKNVKTQIQESMAIANSSGRQLKDVLQERSEIVKALAPDAGGVQYVDGKFVTQIQQVSNIIGAQSQGGYTDVKSANEHIANMQRSRQNSDNLFGGAALLDYMLANRDNYSHIDEESWQRLESQQKAIRQAMANNEREEAKALSEGGRNLITDIFGDEINPAILRRALQEHGNTYYNFSTADGLSRYMTELAQESNMDLSTGRSSDIKESLDFEQQMNHATDIVRHTGLNEAEINRITSAIDTYRTAEENDTTKEWEDTYVREAAEIGYSSKQIKDQLDHVRALSRSGISGDKLKDYIKFATINTDTTIVGHQAEATAWREQYKQYVSKKTENRGLSIPELIIAGMFGDGSGNLSQSEIFDMEYNEYLEDNNKTPGRDSLDTYFQDTDEIAGAALGQINIAGDFVDANGKNINKEVADSLRARYASGDEEIVELFKNIGLQNEEQRKQFLASIEEEGLRGLQEATKENSNVVIDHSAGEFYIADAKQLQSSAVEKNKELQEYSKVNFAQYTAFKEGIPLSEEERAAELTRARDRRYGDNGEKSWDDLTDAERENIEREINTRTKGEDAAGNITEKEYNEILTKMYGTYKTEDLKRYGILDAEGKFQKGVFKGLQKDDTPENTDSALDFLNTVDGDTGKTRATMLAEYQETLSKSEDHPLSQLVSSISGGVNDLNNTATNIANLIKQMFNNNTGAGGSAENPAPAPVPGG